MTYISISQAFEQWQEFAASIPADDGPMLSESWNNYTDSLCKDGELSALQYHYCPAYDDSKPGGGSTYDHLAEDRAFILDAMGVKIISVRTGSRPAADQWDRDATHWRVTVRRGSKKMAVAYSMGSAHKGEPDPQDVINSLLLDAECGSGSFSDMCDTLGMNADSIRDHRTWKECKRTAASLTPDRAQEIGQEIQESGAWDSFVTALRNFFSSVADFVRNLF